MCLYFYIKFMQKTSTALLEYLVHSFRTFTHFWSVPSHAFVLICIFYAFSCMFMCLYFNIKFICTFTALPAFWCIHFAHLHISDAYIFMRLLLFAYFMHFLACLCVYTFIHSLYTHIYCITCIFRAFISHIYTFRKRTYSCVCICMHASVNFVALFFFVFSCCVGAWVQAHCVGEADWLEPPRERRATSHVSPMRLLRPPR